MRTPTRSMAANLRWSRTGTVWADWLLTGLPYGLRPVKDKQQVRALHQALFRALPGESLLLGLCSGLDPAAVVTRMLDGVDLAACPDWVTECEATLDTLDAIGPGQRIYWLSVPLGVDKPSDRALEPVRAATADLRDRIGLPRAPIPAGEVRRRLTQAARVAETIPAPFKPTPATPAQMVWLHEHTIRRGLFQDLDVPTTASNDVPAQLLTAKASSALTEPWLDEAGQSDLPGRSLARLNPLGRRFLKVADAAAVDAGPASYQSLLVVADVPDAGMVFPGSELVGRIDESGLYVDWAMRLSVRASAAVAAKNQRALRNLNEQFGQREGEMSHGLNMLERVASDLAEYVASLESDKLEVETQATTIFCVAGPDADTARAQARALSDFLAAAGYKLAQPLGYQEQLWWAMHPGVPSGRAVREFAQITTSKALAVTIPLASVALGDTKGSLLGLNIGHGPLLGPNVPCGPTSVILHDLDGASDRHISGSMAVAGELGAGKALALDTPIPTPSGWAQMGELAAGDLVFDEMGQPTVVAATSPVMTGHPCYEVVFCDGSTIVADAEHLWTTLPDRVSSQPAQVNDQTRIRGHAAVDGLAETTELHGMSGWPDRAVTVTTENIKHTLGVRGQATHAIPVAGPLNLPEADLPIHPYVLGAWLADGHSRSTCIRPANPPRQANITLATHLVAPRVAGDAECADDARTNATPHRTRSGMARRYHHGSAINGRPQLLRLSHHNKHIPTAYLRSSITQRRALLAGLLDAQGTESSGRLAEFTTSTARLAHDVFELVCSLGHRAALREGVPEPRGRGWVPEWTISFSEIDPHRQPGTSEALSERTDRHTPARHQFRCIVAVREVASVPVRCIRVANPSGLFLAGRAMVPTHNTNTLMKLAGDVIDRGGRLIIADRTAKGEWATWAQAVTRSVVVDAAAPAVSLDPLRLFGPRVGSRIMQTFLTPLLNVTPTSDRGVLLSDVLDPGYMGQHQLGSCGELLAHLHEGCTLAGAQELGRLVNVFARRDLGRVIFDGSVPPVDLTSARAVVVRTHTLMLPSREELEHEHLFTQLGLEKIFGRALNALIAALARHVCFADTSVLAGFVVSEAHSMTVSFEGERELVEFVRDGRKHRAVVLLDSHDPQADFGSPTLRGLIPTRILMRHRDKTLARRGLAWLDLDESDEDLLDLVRNDLSPVVGGLEVPEHRRGECLMRDMSGNVGRGKILLPAVLERNAAIRAAGAAAVRE